MKTFTDNTGRVWTLAVNVAAIKRGRALCGVDLTAIVELDKDNNPDTKLLEQLSSVPVLLYRLPSPFRNPRQSRPFGHTLPC